MREEALGSRAFPMSLSRRILSAALAFGAILLANIRVTGNGQHHDGFTPYLLTPPPQRAVGDFDGDGRPDLALIQDGNDGASISVELSGSAKATRLAVNVTGVVQDDIDHDGDPDLIAATPSGDVLIWINDGHGHFTRQPAASHEPGLSGAKVIGDTGFDEPATLGVTALTPAPSNRAETAVVVTQIRPPTVPRVFSFALGLLPSFRAPPAFAI